MTIVGSENFAISQAINLWPLTACAWQIPIQAAARSWNKPWQWVRQLSCFKAERLEAGMGAVGFQSRA